MAITDFDFSRKKVRFQGRVLDKYSLASYAHELLISLGYGYYNKFHVAHISPECFTYKEIRDDLLAFCISCC